MEDKITIYSNYLRFLVMPATSKCPGQQDTGPGHYIASLLGKLTSRRRSGLLDVYGRGVTSHIQIELIDTIHIR